MKVGLAMRDEQQETPLLLDIHEAARKMRISERNLWARTNAGEIPHVRIGGRLLYPVEGLRRWIERQTTGGDQQKILDST
jgi:hypothetical protein